MTTISELAEKGKLIKNKAEIEKRVKTEKSQNKLKGLRFFGSFRRSTVNGQLMYLGGVIVLYALMMPMIHNNHYFLAPINLIILSVGLSICVLTLFFTYYHIRLIKNWSKELPFEIPSYYMAFKNSCFSSMGMLNKRRFMIIGIEVEFEKEINCGFVENAILGLNKKGITVNFEKKSDDYLLEELENPEETVFPPEDDEEYFNTPDISESEIKKREQIKVVKIEGNHFANGDRFHSYFKRLCQEVLIPLHTTNNIIKIRLSNQGSAKFY